MIPKFLNPPSLPRKPGVYIFKDSLEKVLYVGKAIDLYHRIASYFPPVSPKQEALVGKIAGLETIQVESELEALILEANLIKKFKPPFNVALTDDKDYLYIAITREDFPKVITSRKQDLKKVKKYWGPFPSSRTVRNTLKSLRKVFPWCSSGLQGQTLRSSRPCFYYHLGLCPGPCTGVISKQDYQKIITRFSKFMDGKKEQLITELSTEMKQESEKQRFEQAAKAKKIIEGILYLTQINRTKLYLENPNFLQEENQLVLEQLKNDLNLEKLPDRIEGYDISNIQGKEATGSMVVLTNGEIDNSQYRRFKINPPAGGFGKPNDVGMMREMIRRRLNHSEWMMPNLVIVDGGRGQAKIAQLEIENWKLKIPVYGLAKRMEWLYSPQGDVIKLPKRSLSLKLLQKLRDEAHRFAVNYHRKLHRQVILNII